jgi:MATE family multidrug resistance protein
VKVSVTNNNIIRLAVPISLAMIIPLINDLTNNYFLGKVGLRELAVNGVSSIFYLALTMVGYGLANGIQVQLSRRAANLDYKGITRIFVNGALLTILLALSLMMLSLWLAPIIFGLSLHNSDHVYMSINFLYVRVWGLPFLMLTQLANAFYIATGRSKYLMAGSLVTTLSNVFFDYAFIFGNYGMPRMGLEGAALASVCAEMLGFGMMYALFYLRRLYNQFPIHNHFVLDIKQCRRMLRIATPLIVQYFFSIGGWVIFFIFVEHLGERELAASQILRSLFRIVSVSTWAFAATCNSMVSNIIGQGRQRDVLGLVHKVAKISFLSTAVICMVMLLSARFYLSLFTDDMGLIEMALPSLRVVTVATLVMSLSTVVFNGVVGTGKTTANLIIEIASVFIYLVYCYIVIERMRSPLYVAWLSEFVYWTSLLIIGYAYLRWGRWRGKLV